MNGEYNTHPRPLRHLALVGLGFGDCAKGATTDVLCRDYQFDTVVRFSGGAQTAHHVIRDIGGYHRFAQYGSGTFRGVKTYLSRYALVDPISLAGETDRLSRLGVKNPLSLMTIDGAALVTTPYHAMANKVLENRRGVNHHGSCGVGVGETRRMADRFLADNIKPLQVKDLKNKTETIAALESLLDLYVYEGIFRDEELRLIPGVEELADIYADFYASVSIGDGNQLTELLQSENCLFEGTQGVLLDEWSGFHPYTTWSQTTFDNVNALLVMANQTAYKLGCMRVYATRHGAGPFPTEDGVLGLDLRERHNGTGVYQGSWRAGHLDFVLLKYAIECCIHLDGIALSHLDMLNYTDQRVCRKYTLDGADISAIHPRFDEDLDKQAKLTEILSRVTPVLEPWHMDPEFCIRQETNVPVVMKAYGAFADARKVDIPYLESIRRD